MSSALKALLKAAGIATLLAVPLSACTTRTSAVPPAAEDVYFPSELQIQIRGAAVRSDAVLLRTVDKLSRENPQHALGIAELASVEAPHLSAAISQIVDAAVMDAAAAVPPGPHRVANWPSGQPVPATQQPAVVLTPPPKGSDQGYWRSTQHN